MRTDIWHWVQASLAGGYLNESQTVREVANTNVKVRCATTDEVATICRKLKDRHVSRVCGC